MNAQPAPPSSGEAKPGKVSRFDDSFVDEGNAGAKQLAAERGISVGEATRQLRLMHSAGRTGARLVRDNAATFAGVMVENGRIKVLVKGDDSTGALANARGGVEADLQGAIEVVSVGKSRRELKARAEGLAKQLGTTDALVGYRMAIATNRVELLSTNPEATRTGVRAKLGMVPEDVVVVESEPIELTVDQYGGTAANSGVTSGCPTFGFVVARTTDSNDRGLLTVNHAASTTMKYNGWSDANLNSCSGGTSISLKGRYQTASSVNLGQDFAWYKDSAAIYNAYFWQGDAWGTVRSSIYPAGGITVCKFGRVTKKTCGTTTGNEVYNGSYGWMLEVRKSAGYAKMNDVGDSGGPVWNGSSAAVGIVHAKQGTEIMLVAANYSLEENNLPIRVLIFP